MANYFVIRHLGESKWDIILTGEFDSEEEACTNAAYQTGKSGKYTAFDIDISETYQVEIVKATNNTSVSFDE